MFPRQQSTSTEGNNVHENPFDEARQRSTSTEGNNVHDNPFDEARQPSTSAEGNNVHKNPFDEARQLSTSTEDGKPTKIPELSQLSEADQRAATHLLADNFASCMAALLFSLMTGLSLAPLSSVLAATGRSDQPIKALRRYVSTARHVIAWHLGDPANAACQAGQSSIAVRRAHTHAANSVVGVPVFNTDDMRTVQTAFVAYALLHRRLFGIRCIDNEGPDSPQLAAYARHWHRIGLQLGVPEADSALAGNLRSCRSACGEVQLRLISALQSPPPHFRPLAEALSNGILLIAGDRSSPVLLLPLLLPLRLLLASFSPPAVAAVFLEVSDAPTPMRQRALGAVGYRPFVDAVLARLLRCLLRLLAAAPRWMHRRLFLRACLRLSIDVPDWWLAESYPSGV